MNMISMVFFGVIALVLIFGLLAVIGSAIADRIDKKDREKHK